MKQIVLTPLAQDDLYDIGEYVAEHNQAAAIRLMKQFRQKFDLLAKFPFMGRERNDIAIGIRCLTMGKYVIFYHPYGNTLEIWRIRHSAQDSSNWFSGF